MSEKNRSKNLIVIYQIYPDQNNHLSRCVHRKERTYVIWISIYWKWNND